MGERLAMDPNANVLEQRRIREELAQEGITPARRLELYERLQELEEALAEWLQKGGFAPTV